jgi:hypothetical protein
MRLQIGQSDLPNRIGHGHVQHKRHYARPIGTSRRNGPQTRSLGLANNGGFEPTLAANMRDREPTFPANELILGATSLQMAPRTHIHCKQDREAVAVQKKSGHQFIRTTIVRFIGGYPGIYDWRKQSFSPNTEGCCDEDTSWPPLSVPPNSLQEADHRRLAAMRLTVGNPELA